jgi:hypothetical protein
VGTGLGVGVGWESTLLGPEATGHGRGFHDAGRRWVSYRSAAGVLAFGWGCGGGVGGIGAGGFVRCLRTAQWTRASQMFKLILVREGVFLGFL